ncbi:MAG TPA: glycosyltransferase family 1 protein [Ignavibacteriaceae bacterium]|nr:glycosyltransferase family 1 protein [Ignavibacteriaceae bacterium]
MNIGLNCFNINPKYGGGINTYTFGLLNGFGRRGRNHNFKLFVKSTNKHLFENYKKFTNFEIIELPEVSKFNYYIRAVALLSGESLYKIITDKLYKYVIDEIESRADIVYTPTTILFPLGFKIPTLISMHDIQQIHYPEFFSKTELLNRKVHYDLSAKYATYIQAATNFIKYDLINYYNLKDEQVPVIPSGVDIELFSKKDDNSYLKEKYNIPDDFIFFPAQLWYHKNHITVLKALNILMKEYNLDIPLVMTGAKESAADEIFKFISDNNLSSVHYLGLVPFSDIKVLHQKAKFFITAALYEASSLPMLEASASGTPLIASETPPNKEMGEILKINFYPPKNFEYLAKLIFNIWNNNELIKEQLKYNNEHIYYYSWDNAAERYLDFIEKHINVK